MKASFQSPTTATLIGVLAPVCWGMSVSLYRGVSEGFGRSFGFVLLYACSAAILFFLVGFPNFRKMRPVFCWIGIPIASFRAVCFTLAIFTAQTAEQALEAGMINYLWPSLTILFTVIFTGVRARFWLYPGVIIAFCGIINVLSGDAGFSLSGFVERACANPSCYMLALGSALGFSSYSCMARLWAGGENPSTAVYSLDAILFTILWAFDSSSGSISVSLNVHSVTSLLIGSAVMGSAHAMWIHGFEHGHPAVLSTVSYFTPALSCLFGLFWLGASLSANFWIGVLLVIIGSITCASATSRHFNPPRENTCDGNGCLSSKP